MSLVTPTLVTERLRLRTVEDEDAAFLADGDDGSTPADWIADGVTAVIGTAGASGVTVTTASDIVRVPADGAGGAASPASVGAATAVAPSRVAATGASAPWKPPIGVRA